MTISLNQDIQAHATGSTLDSNGNGTTRPEGADPGGDHDELGYRRTRVRTGCLICRRRRVKCDELRPRCVNCSRLGHSCQWPSSDTSVNSSEHRRNTEHQISGKRKQALSSESLSPPLDAERTAQSSKWHMSDQQEGNGHISANPRNVSRRRSTHGHIEHPSGLDTNDGSCLSCEEGIKDMLKADVIDQLLDLYFKHVHVSSWYAVVHQVSFKRRRSEGSVSKIALEGMCLAASVYLPDRARISGLAEHVKASFHIALDKPSLDVLQAMIHHLFYGMTCGPSSSIFMVAGLAARTAYALKLNVEPASHIPPEQAERRRRLMWACFCMDTLVFGGLSEFEQVPPGSLRIQLPCNERNFALGIPDTMQGLPLSCNDPLWQQTSSPAVANAGLITYHLTLLAVRKCIKRYIGNISSEKTFPWQSDSSFARCLVELNSWRSALPPFLELNRQNVQTRLATGQLSSFYSLHCRYHIASMSLHRITTPGSIELLDEAVLAQVPPTWMTMIQRELYGHALLAAEGALSMLTWVEDFVPEDNIVAVAMWECLKTLAKTFEQLHPGEERISLVRESTPRICAALKLLLRGRKYLPAVDQMLPAVVNLMEQSPLRDAIRPDDPSWAAEHSWENLLPDTQELPSATDSPYGRRLDVVHSIILHVHHELSRQGDQEPEANATMMSLPSAASTAEISNVPIGGPFGGTSRPGHISQTIPQPEETYRIVSTPSLTVPARLSIQDTDNWRTIQSAFQNLNETWRQSAMSDTMLAQQTAPAPWELQGSEMDLFWSTNSSTSAQAADQSLPSRETTDWQALLGSSSSYYLRDLGLDPGDFDMFASN